MGSRRRPARLMGRRTGRDRGRSIAYNGSVTAVLKAFRVESIPAAMLIGRRISCQYGHPEGNPIGSFWGQCFGDGTIEKLQAYPAVREPVPAFGWIGNFDDEAKTFDYLISTLTTPDAQPFKGAVAIGLPALGYAIGTIEGTVPDLFMAACGLVNAELEKQGLDRNHTHRFEMEAYDQRFTHDAPTTVIEFWVPLEPAL